MAAKSISIKLLKQFKPLNRLTDKQLVLLAAQVQLLRFQPKDQVLALGSQDRNEYFLLKGRVKLESFDQRVRQIDAGTESALTAIALLQPRKYTVTAVTECVFIKVAQSVVETLLADLPKEKSVEFSVRDVHSGHEVEDIEESFKRDLETNNIGLPSFPEVAMRIRQLLDTPFVTAKDIGDAITADPAIAVKVLKTANSALYPSPQKIDSCQDAVVRLGFETTRQLVNIFAMKELFKSRSSQLLARMSELWSHSREVAAIAYVLSEHTPGTSPERAMLAGLIQDIGVVPILGYIERYPDFMRVESKIEEIVARLKANIGVTMLEAWDFDESFIEVVRQSENWHYDSREEESTYANIVIVAQIHALIGKQQDQGLPAFSEIPAFSRIGTNGLSPEESREVLLESHQRIANLKYLLTM